MVYEETHCLLLTTTWCDRGSGILVIGVNYEQGIITDPSVGASRKCQSKLNAVSAQTRREGGRTWVPFISADFGRYASFMSHLLIVGV